MKSFFIVSILLMANLSMASDELKGYWAKYDQTLSYSDGKIEKSSQTKELISADVVKNEYVVRTTQYKSDGTIEDQVDETEDDFLSPEKGELVVQNCAQAGGTNATTTFGGKTYNACQLVDGEFPENKILLGGVPFGIFELRYVFSLELPGGDSVEVLVTEKLNSFGKR